MVMSDRLASHEHPGLEVVESDADELCGLYVFALYLLVTVLLP